MIPILSIQPLVENAVKHGVAAKAGRGRVVVRVQNEQGSLHITVEDTGTGFSATVRQPIMALASASPMCGGV